MSIVDNRGRLFGRLNLVDAAVIILILILIPIGYATYLLFRPVSAPRIDEVTPADITKTEERLSVGGRVTAKFKVRGNGFTPLLRARVGDVDALAFVFENPNSADLLVGPIPPGAHDLVLVDGRQEVARAKEAIVIQDIVAGAAMRAVGWLVNLDAESAKSITVGTALPAGAPVYRVLALGPLVSGYRRLTLAGSTLEMAVAGRQARRAVVWLSCDSTVSANPCLMAERAENRAAPVALPLPGPGRPFVLEIDEVLPPEAPEKATLRVRLSSSSTLVKQGDRDLLLDERAAVVTSINGDIVTLDAGIDRTRDGWQYRGQRLVPGAPFVFSTSSYEARGVVAALEPKTGKP